ncbi:EF-hand domain-containing family member B-like isoform X2 [Halichondria panicea]|uniref:EF-hand domain-containing family member B-like isoform X2 n=1 Tax=Halichondria panicea TaxID=6063 RepID=UPI00312B3C39
MRYFKLPWRLLQRSFHQSFIVLWCFNKMQAAGDKKIRDRAPEIKAAGKLFPRGGGAKECLVTQNGEDGGRKTPALVRQFQRMTRPEPGVPRLSHAAAPPDKDLRLGIKTISSMAAVDLINPSPKTKFEHVCVNQQEAIYNSNQKAPLGSSHNQSPGLPSGLNPLSTSFGLKTIRTESAGDMVNPQKTASESHNDWDVSEIVDRDYDWSKFTKSSLYGVPTPHDNSGSGANTALHWQGDSEKSAEVVCKRLDDFREKTQPQLGQVHDPLAETLKVDKDHTFGTIVKPDNLSAGALMHTNGPSTYEQSSVFNSGLLSSVRNILKKNNFCNFDGLLRALLYTDLNGIGKIPPADVDEVFFQFDVPLTPDMLDMLVRWCGGDSGVMCSDLVALINWKSEPNQSVLDRVAANIGQTTSPHLKSKYRTSSQKIKAIVGEVKLLTTQSHGVPTIRSDLPAPRIKRVADHTNYGDESGAYGLMYPSIYSNKGVHEKDFFQPRDEATIQGIFDKIGVSMSREVFHELWSEAQKRDPRGQVSVESFRALMEEVQANKMQHQEQQNELAVPVA